FDWNVLDIEVAEAEEIDVSFGTEPIHVDEGLAPADAIATVFVDPPVDFPLVMSWETAEGTAIDNVTDPGDADFTHVSNITVTIPPNTAVFPVDPDDDSVFPIETVVRPDDDLEGNEEFEFVLLGPVGLPVGYLVTSER